MAFVTDSNRPQPLWEPPPTACLNAFGAQKGFPLQRLLRRHHFDWTNGRNPPPCPISQAPPSTTPSIWQISHQRANETAWTPSECKLFLSKFRQYGKHFRGIAEHLPRYGLACSPPN